MTTTVVRAAAVALLALAAGAPSLACPPEPPYDFRDTDAYRALDPAQRQRLEQVVRDFALLWGALDLYADDHGGAVPQRLEELCPHYLLELPRDPFVDAAALPALGDAGEPATEGRFGTASLGGLGYGYRPGGFELRSWCISSVGLPAFPFLAAEGNVGLYRCKGLWLGGQPVHWWTPEPPTQLDWPRVLGPRVIPPIRVDPWPSALQPGTDGVIDLSGLTIFLTPPDPAQPADGDGR